MKKKIVQSLFGIAISIVLFSYCNNKNDTIKIGSTLDLTGPYAAYGKQVKDGILLAMEEINSNGGISGKEIVIDLQDSKSDAKTAVANAQRFLNIDEAKIVIGEISSSATMAMIPVVEQNKAFLFAPASSSPKLSNVSKCFARNWPSDVAEAGNAATFAFREFKSLNPFTIYSNDEYGLGLKNKFDEVFTKLGGHILGSELFEMNTTDFKTILVKLKSLNTDCIYIVGGAKDIGNFIKQYSEMKMKHNIISNSNFLQIDCLNIAGRFANGIIIPTPFYLANDTANIKAVNFYKAYKQKYNREPTITDANAYDAIYLIANAIEKNGYDAVKVAEYIRNLKQYEGVAGKVSFTNGDVERPIIFKIIKNGEVANY